MISESSNITDICVIINENKYNELSKFMKNDLDDNLKNDLNDNLKNILCDFENESNGIKMTLIENSTTITTLDKIGDKFNKNLLNTDKNKKEYVLFIAFYDSKNNWSSFECDIKCNDININNKHKLKKLEYGFYYPFFLHEYGSHARIYMYNINFINEIKSINNISKPDLYILSANVLVNDENYHKKENKKENKEENKKENNNRNYNGNYIIYDDFSVYIKKCYEFIDGNNTDYLPFSCFYLKAVRDDYWYKHDGIFPPYDYEEYEDILLLCFGLNNFIYGKNKKKKYVTNNDLFTVSDVYEKIIQEWKESNDIYNPSDYIDNIDNRNIGIGDEFLEGYIDKIENFVFTSDDKITYQNLESNFENEITKKNNLIVKNNKILKNIDISSLKSSIFKYCEENVILQSLEEVEWDGPSGSYRERYLDNCIPIFGFVKIKETKKNNYGNIEIHI